MYVDRSFIFLQVVLILFNLFVYSVSCIAMFDTFIFRFHFATIAFSYVLGCLACYYGLNSSILHDYIEKLKCHFVGETRKDEGKAPVKVSEHTFCLLFTCFY